VRPFGTPEHRGWLDGFCLPLSRTLLHRLISFPDFVPVLRHLDNLIVTPALVVLAVRLSPEKVMFECKNLKFQSATSAPKLESPL
jgi:hypothetical protein